MIKKFFIVLLVTLSAVSVSLAQDPSDVSIEDDDLSIGSDIFNDYNEDLEEAQVQEDERFYRYGRFFSFYIGLGLTTFDGNRGAAYENDPPTYNIGFTYFTGFQDAFVLGLAFSKHHMYFPDETSGNQGSGGTGYGTIDVSMLRVYFGYRHYIETANLGTAITYSNPYFTGRMEYWYVTNKYREISEEPDDTGGGLGVAVGFGLEFPIKLKESYINVELLWHSVNYHDKNTSIYQSENGGVGYDDLTGNTYTSMVNYVISW